MQRLKKRADFLHTARGVKWAAPAFVLQARPALADKRSHAATDQGEPRLGFTASRKVGGAVERNFARRRLKEAAAQVFPGKARQAHDYVLIARRSTRTAGFNAIVDDLEMAVEKVHMRLDKLAAKQQPGNRTEPTIRCEPMSNRNL